MSFQLITSARIETPAIKYQAWNTKRFIKDITESNFFVWKSPPTESFPADYRNTSLCALSRESSSTRLKGPGANS
jgi:hypothetical protein